MSELEWPCRLATNGPVCPICATRGDTPADKEHRRLLLHIVRDDNNNWDRDPEFADV